MNTYTNCRVLVAVLASATVTAVSAEGNTYVYEDVGGWTIRTDVDRDYRCFAEAEYTNGSVVRAGFNSDDGNFYLSVGDYRWNWVETGTSYDINLAFDDGAQDAFKATGVTLDADYAYPGIRVDIPAEMQEKFVEQFMHGYEMHVMRDGDETLTLALVGSLRATRTLDDCQIAMVNAVDATATSTENSSASLE
jgi:hypothetical protein